MRLPTVIVTAQPIRVYHKNETGVAKQIGNSTATPASQPANAPPAVERGTSTPRKNNPSIGPPTRPITELLASSSVPRCCTRNASRITNAP
jgi:hypothetical protein